jgi:hypothetical protein
MKTRFITLAVALVVVLSVAAAPAPERDPFKGKIVAVSYLEGSNPLKVALEHARVQKLGERFYIVGIVVDSVLPKFKTSGCTLWIPESSVTSIAEYESVDKMTDAHLRLEQAREKLWQGKSGSLPPPPEEKKLEEKGKSPPPEEKKLEDKGK